MSSGSSSSILSKVGRIFGKSTPPVPARAPILETKDAHKAIIPLGRQWTTTEFRVESDQANVRLDRLITSKYDVPKSLLQKLLRKRMIKLERPDFVSQEGAIAESHQIARIPASARLRVQEGDVISLSEVFLTDKKKTSQLRLENITAEKVTELQEMIVFKDENIIVLNKPSGLAVHGGPGIEEHLERFLEAFKFDKPEAPRLVHRLDKETSGLLLLARTRQAAIDLAARFHASSLDKTVKKYYWAIVNGVPSVKEGRIVTNIYKATDDRLTSRADNREDLLDEGKVAITRFRNAGLYIRKVGSKRTKLSLLELEPLTGRTHQLRVHAAEQLGCPIVGDYKYCRHHLANGPLHLHSRKLVLEDYPEAGKNLTFRAPIPHHFVSTMTRFPLFLRKKPVFPKKKLHNRSAAK